jgi:hypothetical protein
VGELSKREDVWQRKATETAIAAAREIVAGLGSLANTPVGKLSDLQWGWIISAALFGWVTTRCEQAIAEGLDQEDAVRLIGGAQSPDQVAIIRTILEPLADQAGIDWSLPMSAWSKDTMVGFLVLAWQLIGKAELARDQGPNRILQKSRSNKSEPTWDDGIAF